MSTNVGSGRFPNTAPLGDVGSSRAGNTAMAVNLGSRRSPALGKKRAQFISNKKAADPKVDRL